MLPKKLKICFTFFIGTIILLCRPEFATAQAIKDQSTSLIEEEVMVDNLYENEYFEILQTREEERIEKNDLTLYLPAYLLDTFTQEEMDELSDTVLYIWDQVENYRHQAALNQSLDIPSAALSPEEGALPFSSLEKFLNALEDAEEEIAFIIKTSSLDPFRLKEVEEEGEAAILSFIQTGDLDRFNWEIVYYTVIIGYLKGLLDNVITTDAQDLTEMIASQISDIIAIREERLECEEYPEITSCDQYMDSIIQQRNRITNYTKSVLAAPSEMADIPMIRTYDPINPPYIIYPPFSYPGFDYIPFNFYPWSIYQFIFPYQNLWFIPSIFGPCKSRSLPGWSTYIQAPGVGHCGDGADMFMINLDSNSRPEMILMAYDDPSGANSFRYRIGWNINEHGQASSWSSYIEVSGLGHLGEGAGLSFINLDSNLRPEMILMAYDSPSGANNFRYRIGWNIDTSGRATSWSSSIQVPGVGHCGDGAGISLINLDSNPRPEMILMAYDDPSGGNSFRYRIGWNIDTSGRAASWSSYIQVPGVGSSGDGAGIFLTNLDSNSRPEMILMAYDDPSGANNFRYRIGWNINTSGTTASWSGYVKVSGVGNSGEGAGLSLYDIDSDGYKEMILMAYDAPSGGNNFRYRIGWDINQVKNFLLSLDTLGHHDFVAPTRIPNSSSSQTAANLYQLSDPVVRTTALEALIDYVNDCNENPTIHKDELTGILCKITLERVLTDPDLIVAAVAWFVDNNMRYTHDSTNRHVLNEILHLNYSPDWDFPIPANYTIKYTNNSAFGNPARFHGDCEDFAILRAALLRALGFNPKYIWNVMDNPITHEYNIVAYQGRFRVLDYGPIPTYLDEKPISNSHRSYYGYNELHGPRAKPGSTQHNYLVTYGNNYPDGAPTCRSWSYKNYYERFCP